MILVTGCTGFIGRHLFEFMMNANIDVVGLCRPGGYEKNLPDNFISAPVESWRKVILKLSPDAIVCCDWHGVDSNARQNYDLQKSNYSRILLSTLSAIESGCKRVMVLGSQSEYGYNALNQSLPETTILRPSDEYAKQKVLLFNKITSLTQETNTIFHWPVLFSAFGSGDRETTFISEAVKAIARGRTFTIASPDTQWNFLHISDVTRSLILVLNHMESLERINIGHSTSKSLFEYGLEIGQALGRSDLIEKLSGPSKLTHHLNPDVTKLLSLGWTPIKEFQSGILEMYNNIAGGSHV